MRVVSCILCISLCLCLAACSAEETEEIKTDNSEGENQKKAIAAFEEYIKNLVNLYYCEIL